MTGYFCVHSDTRGRAGKLSGCMLLLKLYFTQPHNGVMADRHAFPLFYDTLFIDLRNTLAMQVAEARREEKNLWANDVTNVGVAYSGPDSLTTMPPNALYR